MSETAAKSTPPSRTPTGEAIALRIEDAHSAGSWMPWAGFGCALLWWGAGGGTAFALIGAGRLSQFPLALIIGGALAGALPGFMMLMAGFMARESTRSARANALVMEAAARLLTPAREVGKDAQTFASQMRESTEAVDKAMGNALSAMKAMAGELGDERLRVESVAYASADNARDLSERLASERQALETLARDIRQQTADMSEAIPRQAKMMVEAAKAAGEEVGKADDALELRLKAMDQVGKTLAEKLSDLDALALDASSRSETMTFAVTRLEEKLEASRKTVDSAVRAGEMAAAAAGTTGDALRDAVSAALDGAREASQEIHAMSLKASEEAAHSMATLRDTSQEAATAIRVAGMAARAEMDISRPRLTPDTAVLASTDMHSDPAQAEIRPQPHMTPPPMARPKRRRTDRGKEKSVPGSGITARRHTDDSELFESDASDSQEGPGDLPANSTSDNDAFVLRRRKDDDTTRQDNGADTSRGERRRKIPEKEGDAAWRDILADMDHDSPAHAAPEIEILDREGTAQQLIDRLQGSGIQLGQIFRPKDKKKIAAAALKDEHDRRSATRNTAARQVERVAARLKGNPDLMHLARNFVVEEEGDALTALEETKKSGKNASSRLAAYLLVDAALGLTSSY